jgi:hypothetical protein
MKAFTVGWVESSAALDPLQFFRCQAENLDHAEEQFFNAHPSGMVIWVSRGNWVPSSFERVA